MVVGGLGEGPKIDADKALQEMTRPERPPLEPPPGSLGSPGAPGALPEPPPKEDPNQAILDALKREAEAASAAGKK